MARLAEVQGRWEDARRDLEGAISAANVLMQAFSREDGDSPILGRVNASAKLTDARLMLIRVLRKIARDRH